jgi:hypothetical protein
LFLIIGISEIAAFLVESDGEFGKSGSDARLFRTHFTEDGGFEFRDAFQTPGGSDDTVCKDFFRESRWGKFEKEASPEGFVGVRMVAGDREPTSPCHLGDVGSGGKTVLDRVHGRTLFAAVGTRTGGMTGVGTIYSDTTFRRHDEILSQKTT